MRMIAVFVLAGFLLATGCGKPPEAQLKGLAEKIEKGAPGLKRGDLGTMDLSPFGLPAVDKVHLVELRGPGMVAVASLAKNPRAFAIISAGSVDGGPRTVCSRQPFVVIIMEDTADGKVLASVKKALPDCTVAKKDR